MHVIIITLAGDICLNINSFHVLSHFIFCHDSVSCNTLIASYNYRIASGQLCYCPRNLNRVCVIWGWAQVSSQFGA